jgi:hypothetical protein
VIARGRGDTELQHSATICGELVPMPVTLWNRGDMLSFTGAVKTIFPVRRSEHGRIGVAGPII